MSSEFTIKRGPTQWDARIFSENGEQIAKIIKGEGLEFKLISQKDNREWVLTNKIDGQHQRFSFSVREAEKKGVKAEERRGGKEKDNALLTVRDNIFMHNGKFYMLANHPEGKLWHNHINSPIRYISRLDNFPYSNISEMDENKHHQNLRHKLKRFRGVPVGEASGLGATTEGHHVKVNDELDDIGLFLAATSYLMYASA
ncbi:MAG: hypothetical protein M3299_11875 [Thermoproteota archaeon]|nr:hypothetical protein [Thermoproteota archaeon]